MIGTSRIRPKKRAMAVMIIREGPTIPRVAARAPAIPLRRKPTKVAVLMAIIPGVAWAMA
jgi:hypothetical protein